MSPSIQRLLGYTAAEAVQLSITKTLTPQGIAVVRSLLDQALATVESGQRFKEGTMEVEQIRKDGSVVMTEVSYSGMYDESGKMVAIQGVGRDITERKLAEVNLALARDEAQAANRAKSQFLATMSHEIRTPMTAILGYADLLMDPTLDAEKRNGYATTIHRSGEHLLGLINDILDLSKIEAGKMTLSPGQCRLVSLLADVASLVRPRAEQHGVSFSVEYASSIPEFILTDTARLRQTIVNLAGNAVKFTEKGSVRIVATFLPDAYKGQPAVRIDVIDTGIGISRDVLPRLFRPFSQGEASVAQRFGGTGLGLAISYHLARMLGGDLDVSSEFGQGSVFTLTIPTGSLDGVPMLQNPAEAAMERTGREWAPETKNLLGVQVLLAEDGIDNRELIQTILHRVGARVETAENGRIAVDRTGEQSFDLILMDMNMPDMDGYEATSLLRDRGYTGPIVALTANAMIGDNERCRAVGCDAYLTKPIDRRQLIQTIASFVNLDEAAARVPKTEPSAGTAEEGKTPNDFSNLVAPPSIEGAIISKFINDPDMAPIIPKFVERLADQLDAMQKWQINHNHVELRRQAHKLKGAGGSYGFPQLSEACKPLEEAAQAADNAAELAALDQVALLIRAIEKAYPATPVGQGQ